jgi:hypothetical protein
MSNKSDQTNTYSRHLATIQGHKIYLADESAEKDGCELTLGNSCRFVEWGKSALSAFKEFRMCNSKIPRGARFFVYFIDFNYQSYEIWSRDYQ